MGVDEILCPPHGSLSWDRISLFALSQRIVSTETATCVRLRRPVWSFQQDFSVEKEGNLKADMLGGKNGSDRKYSSKLVNLTMKKHPRYVG